MKKKTFFWMGVAAAAAGAVAAKKMGVPEAIQKWIIFHPMAPIPAKGIKKIACVGDSITYGDGVKPLRHQRSYPALLEGLFGGEVQVLNYGLNGRTAMAAGNRPYTKEPFYALSKKSGADIYILMLGTNDTKPINWNAENYEPELTAFVRSYQALPNHPEVYLMQPPKCFVVDGATEVAYDIRNELIQDEVRPMVKNVADITGAKLIDLYSLTEEHPEYFDDGVHPNFEGNKVIAKYIYDCLQGME